MSRARTGAAVQPRPTTLTAGEPRTSTDEELLERFLNRGGEAAEAAFRALVERHGPMVLGVCRHVLGQQQDAEDAFQATFLVLARKGRTIRSRNILGRWLYEVAYRIALRAKAQAVRRRVQERQATEMSPPAPENEAAWNELRPVLHEEVNRLPEKYRTPVVLCYLEGKTNEEVAQLLQWPVGTVKGRLSRARDLLRSRLMRRGLALSAGFLLTALSENRVFAEVVPTPLVESTVRSGMLVSSLKAAEGGALSLAVEAGILSADVAALLQLELIGRASGRWPPSASLLVLLWGGGLLIFWVVLAGWLLGTDPPLRAGAAPPSSLWTLTQRLISLPMNAFSSGSCHTPAESP
jgi:RNA polymerase sigma factor (sigma-70 family)